MRTTVIAIGIYAIAMTLANLSVAQWGPSVTAINAFVLIGLDLALRDWLHFRLKAWQMGGLIVATGALTFILNPAAGMIAVASSVAFTAAALVDWATFANIRGTWMQRANYSNVAGAAVDSLIFPTIAFGSLMPQIVLAQFVAKVAGGAMWTWALRLATRQGERLMDTPAFAWRELEQLVGSYPEAGIPMTKGRPVPAAAVVVPAKWMVMADDYAEILVKRVAVQVVDFYPEVSR